MTSSTRTVPVSSGSTSSPVAADDGGMGSSEGPRAGGPSRRRAFTPAEKLEHLKSYVDACTEKDGGAYLRREGLYSSQVVEWRKLRDAGVLDGVNPGKKVGRPTAEQAELARLRRQVQVMQQRLDTTETALTIMGSGLSISLPASAELPSRRSTLVAWWLNYQSPAPSQIASTSTLPESKMDTSRLTPWRGADC